MNEHSILLWRIAEKDNFLSGPIMNKPVYQKIWRACAQSGLNLSNLNANYDETLRQFIKDLQSRQERKEWYSACKMIEDLRHIFREETFRFLYRGDYTLFKFEVPLEYVKSGKNQSLFYGNEAKNLHPYKNVYKSPLNPTFEDRSKS